VTAVLFTFIPIFGAYAVPLMVGGKDSYMLGNIIADQVTKTRNWPLASSISMSVTFMTAVAAMLYALRSRSQSAKAQERIAESLRKTPKDGNFPGAAPDFGASSGSHGRGERR
jgi:spermidine/putrescine transport system permease protein